MATLQELVRTWSNANYYDVEQIQTKRDCYIITFDCDYMYFKDLRRLDEYLRINIGKYISGVLTFNNRLEVIVR